MEEAPERTLPWVRQRSRWLKGFLQTVAVQLRRPAELDFRAIISLAMTIGASILSAALHGPALLVCGVLAVTGLAGINAAALGLLVTGYAASIMCGAFAIRRAGLRTRWIDLLRMPLYWPMQAIAAIIALVELQLRPYFWAKTEHGFTRAPEPPCPLPSPSFSLPSRRRPSFSVLGRPATSQTRQKARA